MGMEIKDIPPTFFEQHLDWDNIRILLDVTEKTPGAIYCAILYLCKTGLHVMTFPEETWELYDPLDILNHAPGYFCCWSFHE